MADSPSTNGRDGRGRFTPGNPGGPGNPHAKRVAELRSAVLEAVTADDLRAVIGKLLERAKAGELGAVEILFDRVFGKAAIAVGLTAEVNEVGREDAPTIQEILDALDDQYGPELDELARRYATGTLGNSASPPA